LAEVERSVNFGRGAIVVERDSLMALSASDVPQLAQNRKCAGFETPHFRQKASSKTPQLRQNRLSGELFELQ
jgi:hypothetical protein